MIIHAVFPDGRVIEKTYEGNPGEAAVISDNTTHILNRLVTIWSEDTRFVLNQIEQLNADSSSKLFGCIDTNSIGIFGHSFGGATAAQVCLDDMPLQKEFLVMRLFGGTGSIGNKHSLAVISS